MLIFDQEVARFTEIKLKDAFVSHPYFVLD